MRIHFVQHVSFETPGYLINWAESRKYPVTFSKLFESNSFVQTNLFDVLVILGGPMGVYEEQKYPWLKEEKNFIKKAIADNKKVLGICLGAQLVAEALGAKVYPHHQKEIGWWPIHKMNHPETQFLTSHLPEQFVTFHWHGDTFDLPYGSTQLFTSGACDQQGFIHGRNTAAIQFHLEATEVLIKQMICHEKEELVYAPYIQTEQKINEETNSRVQLLEGYMTGFINNFLAY